MYELLEILHPAKYRLKLPSAGQNEVKANILLTRRLTNNPDQSSAKHSNVESIVARLTSNPPVTRDALRPANFVKEINPPVSKSRQRRPASLLAPSPA